MGGVEVDTLEEKVDLNGGLVGGGEEGTLGTLASSAETTEARGLPDMSGNHRYVNKLKDNGNNGELTLVVFALELLDEVVDEMVVKVLHTQVRVSAVALNSRAP